MSETCWEHKTVFGQCTSMSVMLQCSLTGPLVEGCCAMTALQRHLDPAKLLPCKKGHCKRATYPKHVLVPVLFCRGKRVDLREVEPQQRCFCWSCAAGVAALMFNRVQRLHGLHLLSQRCYNFLDMWISFGRQGLETWVCEGLPPFFPKGHCFLFPGAALINNLWELALFAMPHL